MFYDACVQEFSEEKYFIYRSGKLVIEESLHGGILVSCGTNTSGYPLSVLNTMPTRLNPDEFNEYGAFSFELNGTECNRVLEYVSFEKEITDSGIHCVLTLRSRIMPVEFLIHTVLDGTQMITRYIEAKNSGDTTLSLSRLSVHGGALEKVICNDFAFFEFPDTQSIWSVGNFSNDSWGHEGDFKWETLKPGTSCLSTHYYAERFRHPLLYIRNNVTGEITFAQIGWSSGSSFIIHNNSHPTKSTAFLSYSAEITSGKPMHYISPSQTFTSPEVHFGKVHGELDDAVFETHSHLRRSVFTLSGTKSGCLIGAGMGAEHDMSVETTKAYMRQMNDMGAEVFIIDAGWSCPPGEQMRWNDYNGINLPDNKRYPDTAFSALYEYCHCLGMKFGLWVEIERIGKMSDIFRLHPDWAGKDKYGNILYDFLDFTNPGAAEWAENELSRIIEEYKLDLLRVDYNSTMRECERYSDNGECVSIRHFNAVYNMYRRLKEKYPNVIFENCSGGGGRTDTGLMRFFNHTWVSDNQKMPASVRITNGMTMALPPEKVDRLFAGMECHTIGEIKSHMRNTMLTHMSLNVIAPPDITPNTEAMDFVRHSTDIYKSFIRPFLPACRTYHLTAENEDVKDKDYSALQIVSDDKEKSAVAVFADINSNKGRFTVYPKGINAGFNYTVTFDNSSEKVLLRGYDIIKDGITVIIPSSLSSELILLEKN